MNVMGDVIGQQRQYEQDAEEERHHGHRIGGPVQGNHAACHGLGELQAVKRAEGGSNPSADG